MTTPKNASLPKKLFSLWLLAVIAGVVALASFLGHLGYEAPPSPAPKTPLASPLSSEDASCPAPGQAPEPVPGPAETGQASAPAPTPAFDPAAATHLITAVPLQGMRQITDDDERFVLLPPGNVALVQVIRRDMLPEVLGADDAPSLTLTPPSGLPAPSFTADGPAWLSAPVPVTPYAGKTFEPYPTAVLTVKEADGKTGGETALALPASTETGCRNCHGGPWKESGKAGLSTATALNILAAHDRRNGTSLAADAADGKPWNCRACHAGSSALSAFALPGYAPAEDAGEIPPDCPLPSSFSQGPPPGLSAAVHGFHAAMDLSGPEACGLCHASAEDGPSRMFRGLHFSIGLDCTRCHGEMTDHALSLLRFEAAQGRPAAERRLRQLTPKAVATLEEVQPRQAWVNMPVCGSCHDFSARPDPARASAFNKWTASADERFTKLLEDTGKLRCPSCHGAVHALYPARERDNIQPLQYQKLAAPLGKNGNCFVCHTEDMGFFVHHKLPGQ